MRVIRLVLSAPIFLFLYPCVCLLCPSEVTAQGVSQPVPQAGLGAQNPFLGGYTPPTPVRDPDAITAVKTSLASMGGAANIGQSSHWIVQALQSFGPSSTSVAWKIAGSGVRIEGSAGQAKSLLVTGNGKAAHLKEGKMENLPFHVVRGLFFPPLVAATLFREFQDPKYSIQYGGPGTLNSRSVVIVKTASNSTYLDSLVTPQTWYFDSVTGLPLRVEFRLMEARVIKNYKTAAVDLSNYHQVSGVLYPFQALRSIEGQQQSMLSVQEIDSTTAIDSSEFDLSGGNQP